MSNYRAIATVTKVLEQILQAAADEAVNGSHVRTRRPEALAGGTVAEPGIDLFLYQVVPNAALWNADLPTRRSDGSLRERPRLALNLHYLLAFRGDEADLEPQRILGNAMRTLHSTAVLSRDQVHSTVTLNPPDYLVDSDLDDAVELVKISPLPLSLEELSKLWSVFFQIPYNLSVAYEATVVVIEGDETPRGALPVADRRVYALPLQAAVIEAVAGSSGGPILAGSTLVVKGRNLRRDVVGVSLGGARVEPLLATATEVRVPLTAPPFPPDALRAGVQGVCLVYPLLLGEPPVEHVGLESNVAAFVLRPRIALAAAPDSTHVTVTVEPALRAGQRAVLLLDTLPGLPPASHAFANRRAEADTAMVAFTVAGVAAGQYFVRVRVDGAESPLILDPGNPSFGPTLIVPP